MTIQSIKHARSKSNEELTVLANKLLPFFLEEGPFLFGDLDFIYGSLNVLMHLKKGWVFEQSTEDKDD